MSPHFEKIVPDAEELAPKPEEEEEEKNGMSRRDFLRGLAAAAAGLIASDAEQAQAKPPKKKESEKKTPQNFPSGDLEGRVLGDLYADYLGTAGRRIGPRIEVDFTRQLKRLWEKKFARFEVNPVATEASKNLIEGYKKGEHAPVTLENYVRDIDRALKPLKTAGTINWQTVKDLKKLDDLGVKTVAAVAGAIDSKALLAYSLTELMPSADGELNLKVLKFLLKNAGPEFLYAVPAISDPMTSFGPYQFTSYALFDTPEEKRGASVMNQAVRSEFKIPGSVIKLREAQHHLAAYLFALDNIALLVRGLDAKQLAIFEKGWRQNIGDLVEFIATAHHLPGYAANNARAWISADMKKPLIEYCGPKLKKYAAKTKANYRAVKTLKFK